MNANKKSNKNASPNVNENSNIEPNDEMECTSEVTINNNIDMSKFPELWKEAWTNPEDELKIFFLYHYYSIHLPNNSFDFIDLNGHSYQMSWNAPIFKKEYAETKAFEANSFYLLSVNEMRQGIYDCLRFIVLSRVKIDENISWHKPFRELKFHHNQSPTYIDLNGFYDIKRDDALLYLISLSDKIYKNLAIPEENFSYINNTNKCQLFTLMLFKRKERIFKCKNEENISQEDNEKSEQQNKHINYIVKLFDYIITQTVINPPPHNNIKLVKTLFNILPLDYDLKIELLTDTIQECRLNKMHLSIDRWISKNKKLYCWAFNYLEQTVNNREIKKVMSKTNLRNIDEYSESEKRQFQSLLRLVINYEFVFNNVFNLKRFNNTTNTKTRRLKNKKQPKDTSASKNIAKQIERLANKSDMTLQETIQQIFDDAINERRSQSNLRQRRESGGGQNNSKTKNLKLSKKPEIKQRSKKLDLSRRKSGLIDDKTLEKLNAKLTKPK